MPEHVLWLVLLLVSIGWYAFLTMYVGWKGIGDIRQMIEALRKRLL